MVADIVIGAGDFTLRAELTIDAGHTTAIVGPNGAGKSTLLRALAGLTPLDRGSITLDGEVLDDPARDVLVPPQHRSVGLMFQDYLLFGHLTALDNVAFGPRRHGRPKVQARATAQEWLDRMGLSDKAGAKPRELSGGQAQRVALARALATDPKLLLLDEPLAALDATTRAEVRRDLRRHLDSFPGVRLIVTHDPVEAMYLADRLVVLEGGRITQSGPPAEITARPRSRYIADLVGTNLFAGTVADGVLVTATGQELVVATEVEGAAFAVLSPRAVSVHRDQPSGSPRNRWSGPIESIDATGDRVRILVGGREPVVAEVTPQACHDLALRDGETVWVAMKATEFEVYPG
jgi:molybdate transport system ATP-binding protein